MGRNGPNNIGTHSEDVPRSLNADMGGEGSPTDRLWQRYRTELAQCSGRGATDVAQRRNDPDERPDTPPRGIWTWLRRPRRAGVNT